jgi:diacylglycerol kinase family enzyme
MPGIGVVVNPVAGRNRNRGDRAGHLATVLGACGVVRETESIHDLADVAGEFLARKVDILGVCGGDGSIHRCLSALIPVYGAEPLPRVLPLRAGTINFVAAAIGCRRGSPERVLGQIVRRYQQGGTYDTTERDLLCVNGTEYGFAVGSGAVVNFLRAYYGRQGTGAASAAWLLATVIASGVLGTKLVRGIAQPVEADVFCDDERVPFRTFTVILGATVERIALGFRPTYLGNRKRGYLHFVGGPVGAWAVLKKLRRLRRGFPLEEPTLYDNLARRLTVRFGRPTSFMIDGDIGDPVEELLVTTGPRITLIRG